MTTFVYTWNAAFDAAPADGDPRSQGASQIRTTRAAVQERMAVDHVWGVGATDGYHLAVTLPPSSAWANTGGAVGGQSQIFTQMQTNGAGTTEPELMYTNSSGNTTQLTQNGSRRSPFIGMIVYLATGTNSAGWIICSGGSFLTANFPGLFNVIGYSYGGAGGTFNVPTFPQINSTSAYIFAGYG